MESEIEIARLETYSESDAAELGRLMTALSSRATGDPIEESLLRAIVESPDYVQVVAHHKARLVGAATVGIVMNPLGRMGRLEAFVTSEDARGMGVGDALWNEVMEWCKEKDIDLEFTSKPDRRDAHRFYEKHGAAVRDTVVFKATPR